VQSISLPEERFVSGGSNDYWTFSRLPRKFLVAIATRAGEGLRKNPEQQQRPNSLSYAHKHGSRTGSYMGRERVRRLGNDHRILVHENVNHMPRSREKEFCTIVEQASLLCAGPGNRAAPTIPRVSLQDSSLPNAFPLPLLQSGDV
jgi:hypothetical protein